MKKKKLLLLLVIASFVSISDLWGQQQAQNSLYYFNPLNYNPAYAGSRDALSLTAIHRIQWTGIDGAPQTTLLSVHSPIRDSHLSIGADLTYDKIGVSKATSAYLDISYYIQLNDKGHRLSFGLKGGFNMFDAPLSQLLAVQPGDPLQYDIDNKYRGNFGAGVYWYGTNHYLGLSALTLLESSVLDNDDINVLEQVRHFYLIGGYIFDVSSSLKLKPSGLVKAVRGAPIEFDVELAGLIYDRIWLGVGYRYDESLRGYLAANITPQLRIGYNYDYIFNDLTKYTGGTHEFMISYDFDFNKSRFKSPRYF